MRFPGFKLSIVLFLLLFATTISAVAPGIVDLLSLGRVNDAIGVLTSRDDPESLNLLSRAYYAIEQWDDAVKSGERAVASSPGNAAYHLWLAREYGRKAGSSNPLLAAGVARKAKTEFERAVQLDPANPEARVDLAQYYTLAPAVMGGGLAKARIQAAQLMSYEVSKSHLVLARAAEKEKNYSEAESQFREALAAARNPAEYWLELASFYRRRGLLEEMQSSVQKAIALPNKSSVTYFDAATELYMGGRDFPSAVQYLLTYLKSGGQVEAAPSFRAHYLLGQIYEQMGHNSAAASEYQASLSLASGFEPARKALNGLQ